MAYLSQSMQDVVAARKQRWLDFYDPARPPSSLFLIRYMPDLPERPWPRPEDRQARVDWAWGKYQLQLEQLAWLDDDTLPFLDLYTGTEIFASAFGCQVYYPENDMPFAMPRVHTAQEADALDAPGLDSPAIAPLFEMAAELRQRAGPGALLRMIDLQSPMDIAALIWEKVYFYPALIQSPDAVRGLAEKIKRYMCLVLDTWFERFGRAFIAHYPDYYMPRGITISEDEVGAVSAKMFDRFFLPELSELSRCYDGIGVHCCANARHQWDGFMRIPGLRLLNLVQPAEMIREAVPFFAGRAPQWHSFCGEGPAYTWPQQHPPQARMVYEVWVDSREEACETSERMRKALNRA